MSLNLKAENTFFIFDEFGMLTVKSDDRSWRDSIGMTVCAWIAYGMPVGGKMISSLLYCYSHNCRHPQYPESELSRDHLSYLLIFRRLLFGGYSNLPVYRRGMYLWSLALQNSKLAEFFYYFFAIPFARFGNVFLRSCRWAGEIGEERDNNWWIKPHKFNVEWWETTGNHFLRGRTRWQKLWAWIIFQIIPAYPLHNKAWQIYVMPKSPKRDTLRKILIKRVAKRNVLVRLVLQDPTVTQQEVDDFPAMTGFPSGVYMDESCRRDIAEDPSEWNTYERDLVHEMWKRGFPCYNCANKEEGHEDFCEFAWDEYNYCTTIWDCLGAK